MQHSGKFRIPIRQRPDPLRGRFTNPGVYETGEVSIRSPVATQTLETIPLQQGHQAWSSPVLVVSQTRTSTRPFPFDACRSGSLAMHQSGQRSSSHALPTVAFPGRTDTVSHLSSGDGLTCSGMRVAGQSVHSCGERREGVKHDMTTGNKARPSQNLMEYFGWSGSRDSRL